jgi:hypothetical protein
MSDSVFQALPVLTDTDRAAIDDYVRQKVKAGVDEYLRRRLKGLAATIATVGGIGGFAFVSLLWSGFDGRLQTAIDNSIKDANSNSQLVQARLTALQSELNQLQSASQLIERTRAATDQIAEVEKDVDAAEKARAILKRTDLQAAANMASTLSSLGAADSQSILKRIDELQASIPTRIEVSRGQQLGYGNRNSFQNFCSDNGQVMIAGSLGTTNLDFAPLCGQLRLVR